MEPSPITPEVEFPTRAWQANEGPALEGAYAEAGKILFELGLPDPHGLQFGEVFHPSGNCESGESGLISTQGWLFPAEADENQRFAISLTGLVYPVARIGKELDFKEELEKLMADEKGLGWRKEPGVCI